MQGPLNLSNVVPKTGAIGFESVLRRPAPCSNSCLCVEPAQHRCPFPGRGSDQSPDRHIPPCVPTLVLQQGSCFLLLFCQEECLRVRPSPQSRCCHSTRLFRVSRVVVVAIQGWPFTIQNKAKIPTNQPDLFTSGRVGCCCSPSHTKHIARGKVLAEQDVGWEDQSSRL